MALTVLDAGVVIAFLDGNDGHHDASRGAVRAASDSGDELVLPASAYSEALVHPFSLGSMAVARIDGFVDELPIRVEPATRAIARQAAELRAKLGTRLRPPDALVLATALHLRADRVITTDRRLRAAAIAVDVVVV